MARLRQGKGGVTASSKSQSASKDSKKSKSGKKNDEVLKEHILAMGGNQEDFDLLKNVGDASGSGVSTADPSLSKDVSKFLKDLNLGGGGLPAAEKKKGKAKEGTTIKAPKPRLAPPPKEPTPPPVEEPKEVPKAQLPSKITFNPKSPFIFQPTSQWYMAVQPLDPGYASTSTITPSQLASLTGRAAEMHEKDIRTFQTSSSSNSSSSEANFLSKIIQSGTLSDRLSALTLLVQSSPLHNIKALENLKMMAERGKGKGGREESLKALRCVVDWWVGGGAPNRKLKYFRDQPLQHPSVTDEHILVWYFEDWLKKYFFSILQILETLSLDPLQYVRMQALTLIFTLLREKPEQEQNLLRLLVNKLGDTEKPLCSRASYHILQLLQSHPAMKSVIVREIIALVLRPVAPTASTAPPPPSTTGLPVSTGKHIRFTDDDPKPAPAPKPKKKPATSAEKKPGNAHARYYATITFNQIVLTPADREVALKLIDVYFEIFKELLGEDADKAEVDEDKGNEEKREVKVDKGGRIREGKAKGKGGGKTRTIEVKGAAGFAEVEDAHSRLISAILTGVNRALPFAKIDANDIGINKHIDTLFLITHTSTFNISLQALVLIQQISASISSSTTASSPTSSVTAKSITDRYYRTLYVSLHDPRLATSSKQAMYLNLLFKSIKADVGNEDGERVKAIIRRFVQLLVSGGSGATEFVAGGLFLLGELFGSIPGLRAMLNKPAKAGVEPYDPRKRDPQYAHASSSPLWELTPLLYHYHPAVSLHARQLLTSQPLTASADLSQNTLSHFLDRFVYKNPKKLKPSEGAPSAKAKGASAMQPAASSNVGVKLMKGEVEDADMVNEAAFLRRKEGDIPVDQLFFHKYFSRKSEREKARAGKIGKRRTDEGLDEDEDEEDEGEEEVFVGVGGSDEEAAGAEAENEEEDSDLEEAEIWKAMKASIPKSMEDDADLLDSDDEENDDDDDLPSDFDMQMNDDESMEEDENSDEDKEEEVDDDDTLSLVEGSDNEDLISLDGDIPGGLIAYDGSDAEDGIADEEWGGINEDGLDGKKRKREETKGEKRKKLRSLPTFASYEDYAKLIENGPEDDI